MNNINNVDDTKKGPSGSPIRVRGELVETNLSVEDKHNIQEKLKKDYLLVGLWVK